MANHEIHYYVGQGSESFGGGQGSSAIATWVAAHFKKQTVGGETVYNLTEPLVLVRERPGADDRLRALLVVGAGRAVALAASFAMLAGDAARAVQADRHRHGASASIFDAIAVRSLLAGTDGAVRPPGHVAG